MSAHGPVYPHAYDGCYADDHVIGKDGNGDDVCLCAPPQWCTCGSSWPCSGAAS